jgi:4-alpha-glucanotransferase
MKITKKLFEWKGARASGVLMHPTSLPNQYRIGNLGGTARSFVDLIASSGFKYWQMLPLGPVGFGNSPYQSYSSHAINPMLIDWDDLVRMGWITDPELALLKADGQETRVDFDAIQGPSDVLRFKALKKGLESGALAEEFSQFKKEHGSWVKTYALFRLFHKKNPEKPISKWKKNHRNYEEAIEVKLNSRDKEFVEITIFEQFVLLRQWLQLKQYANERGIQIIGDIPIYVSPDSDDLWGHIDNFQATKTRSCSKLAGVPPDYFNENGQFWGNPLYNWKYLKETKYAFWIERLRHTLSLFDVVRFDHFRALESYWSIPAKAETAKEGKWVKGPGLEFFEEIQKQLPDAQMILEDLGDINQEVVDLKDATGFPGLAVLHFAFGEKSDNEYLPHNVSENTVIYAGTHDNDTTVGWYNSATDKIKDHLRRYFRVSGDDVAWDLIRACYQSNACLCVLMVQDILMLDENSRMNVPGTAENNWNWRLTSDEMFRIGANHSKALRGLADLYGRI